MRNPFSLFQIANAAAYGAVAAILYSDPAQYALEGGEPENTYPNKAWLPASGVQRGSLYTMPGNGDPQTPGIAALEGMYRRPYNESELPPIPAHPMGYGDAIHFLKRMGGTFCINWFRSLSFSIDDLKKRSLNTPRFGRWRDYSRTEFLFKVGSRLATCRSFVLHETFRYGGNLAFF